MRSYITRALIVTALAALPTASCDQGHLVERRTVVAMDTAVELTAVGTQRDELTAALDAAVAEIRAVEAAASLGDPSSELSRLNAAGGGEALSPELAAILDLALEVAAKSDGAFDPTVRPLLTAYGFTDGEWRVPEAEELAAARELVDYRRVVYENGALELPPGFILDLGGIAKGWAVDRALAVLESAGLAGGLVNAGGDIACFGSSPGGGPWRIGIQHPRASEELYAVVELDGGAVATSGDYERCFERDGRRYHHLLDPRTGEPARRAVSATVTAPSCAEADAYATAVFVLGPEEGSALIETLPGLESLIVDPALDAHAGSGFPAADR